MIKLLAADVGFRSTGMAIFEHTPEGWQLFDSKCIHTEQGHTVCVRNKRNKLVKRQLSYVAVDDVRRSEFMATEILNYFLENQCQALACEIPNGGAQSAAAQKCMGLATGIIAVVHVALRCPAEWITPNESREAAGWVKKDHPGADTNELKRFVMGAMEAKYPAISEQLIKDKEHIADACATFEAARGRDMVKQLEAA